VNLLDLNPGQREAAKTIEGPVLILAGAGSGKTKTITYRIAHMIQNYDIPPEQILAVTFTNKAAGEMRERVIRAIGRTKTEAMTLSTFHSLGLMILKSELHRLGYHRSFSIYDQSDQLSLITEALKNYRSDKKFDRKEIQAKIGNLKNKGMTPEDFRNHASFKIADPIDQVTDYAYEYYQKKLKYFNAIDFDDILLLTNQIFRQFPEVATKYSKQFQFIMVDEYQDTNSLQFNLIQSLTTTHQNLCVVGDDDQAIYGFRGADVSNILSFAKNYPKAKVIKLEQNYRSTNHILKLANEVIAHSKKRNDKKMWSEDQSGEAPLLWLMADSDHEAAVVVDDISQHYKKYGKLNNLVVLYRSNTQAPPFEDQLRMNEIPYQIIGGQKLYEKKEIKDLIAYLSIIANPSNEGALRRILNVPHRGIGPGTVEPLIEIARKNNLSLFKTMETHDLAEIKSHQKLKSFAQLIQRYRAKFYSESLSSALKDLLNELEFNAWIDQQYDNPKKAHVKKNDVLFLIASAERFEKIYSAKSKTLLNDFLEKILLQDHQEKDDPNAKIPELVTLMTLHSSKGLEYEKVYLVGVEEELLPHKKTITENSDIDEERRLTYVGITRAKKQLIMTACKERKFYGKNLPRFRSRFINELRHLYTTQDRTTFGHLTEQETKDYKKSFFENLINSID
jgi:DNA helicase-2/ATP-dependent DNA helicase PcrA